MSQLADVIDIVRGQPLPIEDKANLLIDLLEALHWELETVQSTSDAIDFLLGRHA